MSQINRRKILQMSAVGSAIITAPAILSSKALASSGEVNVYAWGDYIQDNIKQAFEADTGIKMNISTYGSNDELQNKLRAAGGKGYDLVFPSVDTLPNFQEGDLLQGIDESKVNMDQIVASIVRDTIKLGAVNRGNRVALPFNWGTEAVTYDSSKYSFDDGVSYGEMWKEDGMDGQIAIRQKSSLMTIALLLDATGEVPSNRLEDIYKSEADMRRIFDQCLEFAVKRKQNIGAYWNNATEATSAFTDAGCSIGQTWDTTGIKLSEDDSKWVYTMGKEGGLGWIDTMAIPSGAENLEQTYALINFLMKPEIGAMFTDNTGYNSASVGSVDMMSNEKVKTILKSVYTEEAVSKLWWWHPETPYYSSVRQEYVEKLTNA